MSSVAVSTTPERAAGWVLAWCDYYTRGLPTEVARERRDELAADLYDQRLDAVLSGLPPGAVARSLLARTVLGAPADLSWRTHQLRAVRSAGVKEDSMSALAGRDGWTLVATVLGIIVVAWSAFVGLGVLGALGEDAASDDETWRWVVGLGGLAAAALAAWGIWALTRHPAAAGGALAVSALVSTIWMMWAWFVVGIGLALMVFFIAYSIRSSRSAPAVPA
jgi:hypothetical protein